MAAELHLELGWVQQNERAMGFAMDKVAWTFALREHDVDELSGSVLRQPWRGELEEGREPVTWGKRLTTRW